jgi:hypothetical protein
MTTLIPEGGLRALIELAAPMPPDELLTYLVSRRQIESEETLHVCETELHTRLFLYNLILKRDTSAVPDNVVDELRNNFIACLTLLVNVQWRLRATRNLTGTVRQLLSEDLPSVSSETRQFVGEQIVHLLLDNADGALLSAVADVGTALELSDTLARIVQLAECATDYKPHQPPSTISALKSLATTESEAGVAAHYLLARIYHDLSLPFEERECYASWMVGLARQYQRSAADLAGAVSGNNLAMERVIKQGAIRWLHLLTASGAYADVNQVIEEFKRAGYRDDFESLRVDQGRQPGYEFRSVMRDEVSKNGEMKVLISEIITSSIRQGACVVVRDEANSDVAQFPTVTSVSPEMEILSRLPDQLSRAGMMVLPEIIDEGILHKRKWVVCVDQSRPMDALAVGVLPMETEFSVVYARAIVFDTKLDPAKDQNWFQTTIRLLGQGFDGQKTGIVREAVRRVADQISTGRSSVQVLEL